MYILTGNKPNIKILMTYDVHRPNQIFFLKNYIQFKKNFIDYPFFAELIGEKGTEYNTDKWTKTNKINEPIESNLKLLYLQHDGVIGYELPRNLIYFLSHFWLEVVEEVWAQLLGQIGLPDHKSAAKIELHYLSQLIG